MEIKNIASTLFLPLKARALAHVQPNSFKDQYATDIWNSANVSFIEGDNQNFIDVIVARTELFDRMVKDKVEANKKVLVVNLGAGLCTREQRLSYEKENVEWLHADVSEVINLRKEHFSNTDSNLYSLDLKDREAWVKLLAEVFKNKASQIIFVAEGVFSYFSKTEISQLIEVIIKYKPQSKQVSLCFDFSHPNYHFDTAFKEVKQYEAISFKQNYETIEKLLSSLSIPLQIKKYRLPFEFVYTDLYQYFVEKNQGEEPYYAGCIEFEQSNLQKNEIGVFYEQSLKWNAAYSRTYLQNGLCFFFAKKDFQVLPIQECVRLLSYLEDPNSCGNDFSQIQAIYSIEKLIKANVLIENNLLSYNNDFVVVEDHFFPNKVCFSGNMFEQLIKESNKLNIILIFTHDFNDLQAQKYAKKILTEARKCYLINIEKESVLISPLFKSIDLFNTFVSCIKINVPHVEWAKKLTGKEINIPCSEEILITDKGIEWVQNYINIAENNKLIAEYVYENGEEKQHFIADYEQLEETRSLGLNTELIVDRSSGFRTKKSAEIIKDCESQMSAISGIISVPKIIANLEDRLVTYSCTYPTRIHFDTFEGKQFFNQSLGKGIHKQQSKISAIAEGFERFSMNFNGNEDIVSKEYQPDNAEYIDPLLLFHFSNHQYQNGSYSKLVEGSLIHWTQGYSLTKKKNKFLPAVLCFQNAPFKERKSLRFSSNGCATGNTVKEAVLQGLFELIERDAVALWWYQKRVCPRVDLKNHQNLIEILQAQNWETWVLDVTNDLGIPVMVAVAKHVKTNEFRVGFGAHIDANIAIARAISEVHQIIEVASFAKAEFDFSNIKTEDYLFPTNTIPLVFKSSEISTIDDAIEITTKKIEEQGFEILYKNLSRSNLSLKTVKVFVPGLCFIWPEFGNLRLYKNSLGEVIFSEEELNPLSLFV